MAKKAAPKKSTARKNAAAGKKAPAKRARKGITPEQALANTRRLLEEKQAQARSQQPWQALDGGVGVKDESYQSPEARAKAEELHAAEVRLDGTQGSISTRDRHNQGKRDSR